MFSASRRPKRAEIVEKSKEKERNDSIEALLKSVNLPTRYKHIFEVIGMRSIDDYEHISSELLDSLVTTFKDGGCGLVDLTKPEDAMKYFGCASLNIETLNIPPLDRSRALKLPAALATMKRSYNR